MTKTWQEKGNRQHMGLTPEERQELDKIFKSKGYTDYRWIDPQKIMDVYSTVRRFGFPINVRTVYDQKMDRYSFLMVQ